MNDHLKPILRASIRGSYDLQKVRIQMGNRVVAAFKNKLGYAAGMTEDQLDKAAKRLLKELRAAHDRITDGVVELPDFIGFASQEPLISDFTELSLINGYIRTIREEDESFKRTKKLVPEFTIWSKHLIDVVGCGETMAAVMISELNPHIAKYPSSFWKYAGLDVAEDGKGRSKRKEHLVLKSYIDKKGKEKEKLSITYNPFLKTKLMGVLAPSFLRQKGSHYRLIYDDYKYRLENKSKTDPWTETYQAHRHMAAERYMIKIFLLDLHLRWREIEGLPVPEPYHVAKLGMTPHAA